MKKDLNMPVDYKTETEKKEEQRAAAAGWDGKSPRDLAIEKAGVAAESVLKNLPADQKAAIEKAAAIIKEGDKKE